MGMYTIVYTHLQLLDLVNNWLKGIIELCRCWLLRARHNHRTDHVNLEKTMLAREIID